MKITLQCPICKLQHENNHIKRFGVSYSPIYNSDNNISIIDDFDRGHFCVVYFTNYKYDLLFESGLAATHDLYFREAVASIASSLERFYEYCIEVFTFHLSKEVYNKLWKKFANHSERQIGAYYFLYLNALNSLPNTLSENDISFRNKVIHKGYFPTRDETINFILKVFQIILENFNSIFSKFSEIINSHADLYKQGLILKSREVIDEEVKKLEMNVAISHKKFGDVTNYCFFEKEPFERKVLTFLSENLTSENRLDLEKYINELKKFNVD